MMKPLNMDLVNEFVNNEIVKFHHNRLNKLEQVQLKAVLKRKNPYLFRAKNMQSAQEVIRGMLDASLSSSEEKMFGDFLESLAIFVSSQTCHGRKSSATSIDLEFEQDDIIYLVSIKSGPNWGNSSQKQALRDNFLKAKKVLQQGTNARIQPILGICYGKSKTTDNGIYQQIMGQNFWYFISGDEYLYTGLIDPIGYRAKHHNENFDMKRSALENRLVKEFIDEFCDDSGAIQWNRLVQFNSSNYLG